MKTRLIILFISILTAALIITAGYSLWEERLIIKGIINVVRPEKETLIIPKELPPEEDLLSAEEVDTVTPAGITADYTEDYTDIEETGGIENGSEAGGNDGVIESEGDGSASVNGSLTGDNGPSEGETGYDAENTDDAQQMVTDGSTDKGEGAVE